jgi:mono/diheme cytochrome c family protein
MRTRLFAVVLALLASPSFADEPGPGGTKPPVARNGEEVYRMYCQACHMPGGKGAVGAGAFPPLASNPRLGSPEYAIYVIEHGKAGMPSFTTSLTSTQVAQLVTYLRTHFGNSYGEPVTASDVEAVRKTLAGR